jgi:uncharacterized protein YjbI with pentapeptide repeats
MTRDKKFSRRRALSRQLPSLFTSALVDLSSAKQRAVPLTGRKRRGLRRPSPDLISKAIDDTNAQVTRIGLTFLGTTAFCFLSLLSPDFALLGGNDKINVPLAGPVSFFGFMLLGPAVLVMLRVYLQIYVEHSARLERIGQSMLLLRAPTLVQLKNPLIRFLSAFTFYLAMPIAAAVFAWKAAVFPAWGAGLVIFTVGVIVSHAMLPFDKVFWLPDDEVSWLSKFLSSVAAAALACGLLIVLGSPRRTFNLYHADLSNQWLREADLRGANLTLAKLVGTNLFNADLSGANLESANLSGAELIGANLEDAKLHSAHLAHAHLKYAHLFNADLSEADLREADLREVSLISSNLKDADLTDADLTDAELADAVLTHANLRGAHLDGTDLGGVKNLTQWQLNEACGSERTKLPEVRRHHRINFPHLIKPCS